MSHARMPFAGEAGQRREEQSEEGFTLIELMVVLLIIAILLAIAIPTFLGVTGSANDRAAQSNLTNALTEAKALYQNNQSYNVASIPVATLSASAPEFTWHQSAACASADGKNCVSEEPVDVVSAADGSGMILADLSKTGTCWYIMTLEANPPNAKVNPDTGGTLAVFSGTAAVGAEMNLAGSAGIGSAGSFYSQKASQTSCDARTPANNATGWKWGSSFSAAAAN